MGEDIKILEQNLKNGTIYVNCGNSIDKALENLLTRYKEYDNLLGEIDSKEASDALYMLWHCALINKEFETQKQQFQIVNAYIKKLEKENEELRADNYELNNRITDLLENIPVQKVEDKIEELKKDVINLDTYPNFSEQEVHREIVEVLQKFLRKE